MPRCEHKLEPEDTQVSITIIDTRKTRKPAAGASASDSKLHSVDVLVIDDDHDATYSLCALLRCQLDLRVAAAGSAEALTVVRAQRPAVSLVSAELGPRFIFVLTHLPDAPRVLVHTNRRAPDLDAVAVLAGAVESVWRYDDPDDLADTIRLVAAGGQPPSLACATVQRVIDQVEDHDRPIAAMLLLRTPVEEIARLLGISVSSVRARHLEIVKRLDPAFGGS